MERCSSCKKWIWFWQDVSCFVLHRQCWENSILIGIAAIITEVEKINKRYKSQFK